MSKEGSSLKRIGPLVPVLVLVSLPLTVTRVPASERSQRDYSILIRGHRFEPPETASPEGPATAAAQGRVYRIVQFDGPLTRERTALLKERFGFRLDEYVPHYAFLERLDAAQVEELRKLDFFRWSGPYEPAFKLDPMIGKHEFRTEKRRAETGILLTVVAFPGTVLADLAERVRGLGFEVISTTDEPELEIARLQVRVDEPRDAEALAQLDDVKYVEEVGEVTLNETPGA